MASLFDKDTLFPDRDSSGPITIGFVCLITLGVFAFKSSTGDYQIESGLFGKLLALFVVGVCVLTVGNSFFWLRHIIKNRDKKIEELERQISWPDEN